MGAHRSKQEQACQNITFKVDFANNLLVASQDPNTTMLGKTKQEYAQVLSWCSFGTSQIVSNAGEWFFQANGTWPYLKPSFDSAVAKLHRAMEALNHALVFRTYLVSERLTLADAFVAGCVERTFVHLFGPELRSKYPHATRWFKTVYEQAKLSDFFNHPLTLAEKTLELPKKTPAKSKQAAEQKPKKKVEEAPAAPAAAAPAAEPAEKPKPKHPLADAPNGSFVMDDWKRFYSNNDTRPDALDYFFKNFDKEHYSLWRVDYKYNDELTLTFQSNNLIGGLFQRLEASRKYIFGCLAVFGENNNNCISGAFVIKGDNYEHAFDVAPDWESYNFTKLDPENKEDMEFLGDSWAWDKDLVKDGKTWPFADGKVFK